MAERIEELEGRIAKIEGAVHAMERVQAAVVDQLDALHKEARATREAIADLNRAVASRKPGVFHGGMIGGSGPLQ